MQNIFISCNIFLPSEGCVREIKICMFLFLEETSREETVERMDQEPAVDPIQKEAQPQPGNNTFPCQLFLPIQIRYGSKWGRRQFSKKI